MSRRFARRGCGNSVHIMLTDHLRLQTPTVPDLVIMRATASDEMAQRWLGWQAELVVPEAVREHALARAPGQGNRLPPAAFASGQNLIVIDRASGRAIGLGSLTPDGQIGACLSPQFRGRRLGTELFGALAAFGHEHLGLATVLAGAEPANIASVAALRSAGFVPTSGSQTHLLPDGRVVPACWLRHDVSQAYRCRAA
jgi:RimJ/RimL family protein N-acetyltransferase